MSFGPTLICGFGAIGRRHLRNLRDLGVRDIVVLHTGRGSVPGDDLVGCLVADRLEAALASQPRAALICNPTALHVPVAAACAAAGCNVLIEKPLSDRRAGLETFLDSVRRARVQAMVGFQFRFNLGLKHLKRLIDGDVLGAVLSAHVHWGEYLPDWHPWEDYRKSFAARRDLGGGVVRTLSHGFDYLLWLLGEITAVSARVQRSGRLELDVDDCADVRLEFARGSMATVHLDYLQRPPLHELTISGTDGWARWDAADSQVRWRQAGDADVRVWAPPPGYARNHMFIDELRTFLHAETSGISAPACTLEQGVRNLQIIEAIFASSEAGHLVAV